MQMIVRAAKRRMRTLNSALRDEWVVIWRSVQGQVLCLSGAGIGVRIGARVRVRGRAY